MSPIQEIGKFTLSVVDVLPVAGKPTRPEYDTIYLKIRELAPDRGAMKIEGFRTYSEATSFVAAMKKRMAGDGGFNGANLAARIKQEDEETFTLYLGKVTS